MNDIVFDEIFKKSLAYGTWCNEKKASELYNLIKSYPNPTVVEIGVFMGQSAFIMMELMKRNQINGNFFAIDPWDKEASLDGVNSEANDEWWSSIDIDEIYEKFLRCVADNNFGSICNVVRKKAEDFHYEWRRLPIDILHIDGNHSEEQSVSDVLLWSSAVADGGTVIMDDTEWDTTQKAVELLDVLFTRVDDPEHKENNFLVFKNNG